MGVCFKRMKKIAEVSLSEHTRKWGIYPRTPIKSKIGGKIYPQEHVKTNFYCQFSI